MSREVVVFLFFVLRSFFIYFLFEEKKIKFNNKNDHTCQLSIYLQVLSCTLSGCRSCLLGKYSAFSRSFSGTAHKDDDDDEEEPCWFFHSLKSEQ